MSDLFLFMSIQLVSVTLLKVNNLEKTIFKKN